MAKNQTSAIAQELIDLYNKKRNNAPVVQRVIKSFIVFTDGDEKITKNVALKMEVLNAIDNKDVSTLGNKRILMYLVDIPHGIRTRATTFAETVISAGLKSKDILTSEFRGQIMTNVAGETVYNTDKEGNTSAIVIQTGTCQVVGEYTFVEPAKLALKTKALASLSKEEVMAFLQS